MLGNFTCGKGKESTMEELIELHSNESKKAFKEPNSFTRMDMISREIKKIDYFSFLLSKEKLITPVHEINPIFSPLIIVAPFHNPDIRHIKSANQNGEDEIFKTFLRSLDIEQTQNYIGNSLTHGEDAVKLTGQLAKSKNEYLDNVSLLHASFDFSPILRLPSQGKSIYRNLSFFRTEALGAISQPKNRKNIKKTISRFGHDLAKRTISEKVKQSLITKNRQIVALTDLPIEWLDIDGIPLSFTHDVCRIPETSLHGLLASFTTNEQLEYSVPTDILEKTLVIYGSDEPAFKVWQNPVNALSRTHGFTTQVCLSVDDMVQAIEKFKPDLLIFDCHGGYDANTNSSYLLLGDEQLTGEKIVERNIHAPLIFLSACNTAPTYGTINTIANAFFQTQCLSVTTTYLPINISTGSILYLRLLNNLKMASTEAIHQNWLEFVSYVIRTSAVSDAYTFLSKTDNKHIDSPKAALSQAKSFNQLMSFYNRRRVFKELDQTLRKLSGTEEQVLSKIIPEYLFYSNLGRSDLIKFDVYVDKYDQLNDNTKLKTKKFTL
ncbi:CHAT domain-containing protein [Pedobacter fastidiosus]